MECLSDVMKLKVMSSNTTILGQKQKVSHALFLLL